MFSNAISLTLLLTLFYFLASPSAVVHVAEACSSRTVPKPRPSTTSSSSMAGKRSPTTPTAAPTTTIAATTTAASTSTSTTTARPNITFPTYKCSATYDAWYCLNEATCFSVKIGDSIMYNCECAIGFMGPRCEYKELDGSYLPKRPRPLLEKASIASGATLALLFLLFVCLTLYLRYDQKSKFITFAAEDANSAASAMRCRYCVGKCCSGDVLLDDNIHEEEVVAPSADKWWLHGMAGVGVLGGMAGFAKQQQMKAMPMTFAVKRTTKM